MCNSPEFRSNPFGRPVQHIQAEAQRAADAQSRAIEKLVGDSEAKTKEITENVQREVTKQVDAIKSMTPNMAQANKFTPAAARTGASDNQGVRKKKSKKSSIIDANRGVASLRNPLNIGGSGAGNGTGPNLG